MRKSIANRSISSRETRIAGKKMKEKLTGLFELFDSFGTFGFIEIPHRDGEAHSRRRHNLMRIPSVGPEEDHTVEFRLDIGDNTVVHLRE